MSQSVKGSIEVFLLTLISVFNHFRHFLSHPYHSSSFVVLYVHRNHKAYWGRAKVG